MVSQQEVTSPKASAWGLYRIPKKISSWDTGTRKERKTLEKKGFTCRFSDYRFCWDIHFQVIFLLVSAA